MHAESLGVGVEGQFLEVLDVLVDVGGLRLAVDSGLGKLVADVEGAGVDVDLDDGGDKPNVLVVGDPAAVVDLGAQEVEHLVGNLLVFVEEHLQLLLADHEVLVGEFVGDVPADRPELPPVLDDCMEEAEPEQQFLEFFWLFALVQLPLVEILVSPQQVVPQTLWRL